MSQTTPAGVSDALCSPLYIEPGHGPKFYLGNDQACVKLGSASTAGRLSLAELTVPPGGGPPPHRHSREDEAFYILSGTVEFTVADTVYTGKAGDFIFGQRGIIHTFHNPASDPARMVLYVAPPANFEDFAARCGLDWDGPGCPPPEAVAGVIGRIMRYAPEHGLEILPGHQTTRRANLPSLGHDRCADYWVLGDRVRLLATGAQTGGTLTAVEVSGAPGGGPPPHLHVEQDEVFYVIEGTFEFQLGRMTVRLGAGGVAYAPRRTVHRFSNVGPGPGRFLSLHTPAGMEHFFAECGTPAMNDTPPPFVPPDPKELIALLARHGMELPKQ